jgi:diguanylate cyclase (GGDEF)-like protein
MRDTSLSVAAEVAERLRTLIGAEAVDFQGTDIRVSVSIGVTAMPPISVGSAIELFVRADRLLYQAKETGRNKVCVE